MDSDKLPGVALGPRWQDDITQFGAILLGTWYVKQQRAKRILIFMHSIIFVCLTFIRSYCPRFLILTQVEVVGVEQELGQIEELGDELFDVGHVVFGGREPGFTHTVEHPVSEVKMTSLVITQTQADGLTLCPDT